MKGIAVRSKEFQAEKLVQQLVCGVQYAVFGFSAADKINPARRDGDTAIAPAKPCVAFVFRAAVYENVKNSMFGLCVGCGCFGRASGRFRNKPVQLLKGRVFAFSGAARFEKKS